ncbi:hypothetical protein D3C72_885180 [compost metagenome]
MHVLKNTPLEEMYHKGEYTPIDKETYTRRVEIFLQHLAPHIALHRLAAYSSRWDELVAPDWTKNKMGTHQHIIDHLRLHKSHQAQHFIAQTEAEESLKHFFADRVQPVLP